MMFYIFALVRSYTMWSSILLTLTSSDLNPKLVVSEIWESILFFKILLHWPLKISQQIHGKVQPPERFQPPSRTADNDRVRVSQVELRDNRGEISDCIRLYYGFVWYIGIGPKQECEAGTIPGKSLWNQSWLHQLLSWCWTDDFTPLGHMFLSGYNFPYFRVVSCWNITSIGQRMSTVSV